MQINLQNSHRGRCAHLAGVSAEDAVARAYLDRGYQLVRQRWRCDFGEIDLILRFGDSFVFVEVKKSHNFHHAALRITQRQQERIFASASQFVADLPRGQLTPMRFDAALVNRIGQIDIRENVLHMS